MNTFRLNHHVGEERRLVLFFETVSMHAIVRESIMLLVKQITEGTKIVPMLGNA